MKKLFSPAALFFYGAAITTLIVFRKKRRTEKMRKILNTVKVKTTGVINRAKNVLQNERGDFYISDGVKIIIAVVLGALLLAALTGIFTSQFIVVIVRGH